MNDLRNFNACFNNSELGNIKIKRILYNCSNEGIRKSNNGRLYLVKKGNKIYCDDKSLSLCIGLYKKNSDIRLKDIKYCCIDITSDRLTVIADSINTMLSCNCIKEVLKIKESFCVNPRCRSIREIVKEEEQDVQYMG